jgi:hypothetical protein
MRRLVVVAAAALMAVVLAVGTVAGVGHLWKAPPFSSIGINNVYNIGSDFDVNPDPEGSILRVWMETGSASEKCLAMMGEAYTVTAVDEFFCSSRGVTLDDGNVLWGVYLTLVLAGELADVEVSEGVFDPGWYSLNVYQEGARFYGPPLRVECDDTHCFVF